VKATYFPTPAGLRAWFDEHHRTATELLVGFYKRGSASPSITWPESVDEALAVGWIDGVRRRVDDSRYTIRFTPRRKGSIWSAVNIRRVAVLQAAGRMRPAGLGAFEARMANKSGIYSYEQRPLDLPEPYAATLRKHRAAWTFFRAQAPWYRKTLTWWVVSAKREETRLRRLKILVDASAKGRRLR